MRAARHEIARILTTGLREGDVPALDRTYVAQVVAARTGLNQADAEKRVSDIIDQAKTALDNARKAAAKLSLWLTASLLIGAFSASLAATEGGYVRDNWNPSLTGR
jgi:ribosomal protein L17